MATNKTWLLALVVLAVSLMQLASPAMGAPRHLLQDPLPPAAEGLPAASPAPMPMDSLPGAGGLMGNTTANETAIQECAMLLESYNITLVNATTNETLGPEEAARRGRGGRDRGNSLRDDEFVVG